MYNKSKKTKKLAPMPKALILPLIGILVLSLPAYADVDNGIYKQPDADDQNNLSGNNTYASPNNGICRAVYTGCVNGLNAGNIFYGSSGASSVNTLPYGNTYYTAPGYVNTLPTGNTYCVAPGTACVNNLSSGNTYYVAPGSGYINGFPSGNNIYIVPGAGSAPGLSLGNSLYGAGGTSTLRNPLIPGANFSLPGIPSALGAPPPLGSGFVPLPPNPGMLFASPSIIPWANGTAGNPMSYPTSQVVAPANQIDLPNNQISLPASNVAAMPPGAMNAAVRGSIPHAPSTPGSDPGILRPASFNNGSSGPVAGQSQQSAAALGTVGQNGQLPDGLAPTKRAMRQGTNDFGLNRTTFGYRAQFTNNDGQSSFQQWVPRPGSKTNDFGQSVKELAAEGKTTAGKKAQISYDSPLPAQYPGKSKEGVPAQNDAGNHVKNFVNAQVTNDLYGVPMINPNKMSTDSNGNVSKGSPKPLTTMANY